MAKRKRPYHHGDLRRVLLDASLALIGERGIDQLSLREVARRARVSPAAPYHHFASRRELLAAIAHDGFALLADAMETARDSDEEGDSLQHLRAIGEAYVRFAVAHPDHFRLMFRPSLVPQEDLPESSASGRAFTILLDAVAHVVADPSIASVAESRGLVVVAWSLVHGAAELLLDGPLGTGMPSLAVAPDEVPALVTATFCQILGGLCHRPARARRSAP